MRLFHFLLLKRLLQPLFLLPALLFCTMVVGADSASAAASAGPGWAIQSVAEPSNFSTADTESCETRPACDTYRLTAINVGSGPSEEPVVVRDTLPPGIVLDEVNSAYEIEPGLGGGRTEMPCSEQEKDSTSIRCEYGGAVPPGSVLAITLRVTVEPGAPGMVENKAVVEGGGAAAVATSRPSTVANSVNGIVPLFGAEVLSLAVYGTDDTQAGGHPTALTTTIDYATEANFKLPELSFAAFRAVEEAKTEIVDLPLGFVGNPLAAGQCPESGLFGTEANPSNCPANSQVGTVAIRVEEKTDLRDVYNIVPESGYPAEFGFEFNETIILMRARVVPGRSGYLLSVSVPNVPRSTSVKVTGVTLTFFGDPAEQDAERRRAELERQTEHQVAPEGFTSVAFFTNPSDCSAGPSKARLELNSWVDPQHWASPKETTMYEASPSQSVSGCAALRFDPTIEVAPEETQADTPSGYEVDLKVPQAPNLAPVLATPDLKNAVLTLPEGVSVSPGAADGLVACQETGPEGINITHGWTPTGEQPLDPADPEAMEIAPDGLPHIAPGHCPSKSQIGTVEITTPLLASPLKGHVYVAEPLCGSAGYPACSEAEAADGNLFRLYLEAEGSGVIVKLEGKVSVNPSTGQLTTTFEENPQLPFSELKLALNGGPRAPLANPQSCGEAKTTSSLEPWSALESGPAATPFSSFGVTGCASPQPFSPGFLAQTSTPAAGAFSPFALTFSRHDGEQDLAGLTLNMPDGLIGKIASFAQCGEAEVRAEEANTGGCPATAKVGTVTASAGAGSHPYWQTGPVYLTGPYNGAPFGLAVVVPANAGPYHLGNIVVRAAIHINPKTAQVTVVSNPLPQIIDGVPLRVQTVNVTVGEADNFTFNPTNCAASSVTGTITSAQGASANVSAPFAAAGCKNLPFKPDFSASTTGKTSKALGASLNVKIDSAGLGQANIAKVDVEIPKALPTQLKTLNHACTEAQFNSNPADCPPASDIAQVTVHTPLLNSLLKGPAYLVSHGNETFPDVEMVLQGEGVELVIDGHTQIKKGVTYSHFETVPDAPFTSFEFNSPQGELALFTAHGDLCDQKLTMPVTLTGQNGGVLKQSTSIEVTGCSSSLSVVSSRVKKRTLTLSVYAPGVGKMTASGKGVSSGSKAYSGREALTFTLKQKQAGRLKTKIKLTYTPSNGKRQTKEVRASFRS